MTNPPIRTDYDDVPYPSASYLDSHPNSLATLATISGMTPTPVEHSRILEIGCSDGGNLIPMACALPDSQFVGIDLSAHEIASGQAKAADLELTNLELKLLDIMDVNTDIGQFDYIIAHGIYSWVSPAVQDKLLTICQQHLTPNGVAYISYNTLPGWYMSNVMRDLLLYRTRTLDTSEEQIREARALMKFISESVSAENNLYSHMLHQLAELLLRQTETHMYHDIMEKFNSPVYFHEFIARAEEHQLQFLANADFTGERMQQLSLAAVTYLQGLTEDIVQLEQYRDFLTGQTFRQTLLCHQDVKLNRVLTPDCITTLQIASPVRPTNSEIDISSPDVEEFQAPTEITLSTAHPLTKAALVYLGEIYPRAVPFTELLATAYTRLHPDAAPGAIPSAHDVEMMQTNLFQAHNYNSNLAELHSYLPAMVAHVSERPLTSQLVRYQARDSELRTAINMRHEQIELDEMNRLLLLQMDGTLDHEGLLEIMVDMAKSGVTAIFEDGQMIEDPVRLRAALAEDLNNRLFNLAKSGLLVG